MGEQKRESQGTRVLVCLSSSASNAKVIHAASRIAAAFQGSLTALFVETPSTLQMPDEDRKRLRTNMNLAEKLGARLETVAGDDVPYQIAEFARVSDISSITSCSFSWIRKEIVPSPLMASTAFLSRFSMTH